MTFLIGLMAITRVHIFDTHNYNTFLSHRTPRLSLIITMSGIRNIQRLGNSARLLVNHGQHAMRQTGAFANALSVNQGTHIFLPALTLGGLRGFRDDHYSGAGRGENSPLSQPRTPPGHFGIKCAFC